MKGGRLPRGYTIVEVMMFLAISGSMFLVATVFVNGKQATAEFRQSMNDITIQLRSVISDVANGSYDFPDGIKCTAGLSGDITITNPGGTTQGQNNGCIFMGKVVQFGVQGTNLNGYNIYTVAGRQYASGSAQVGSILGSVAGGSYQKAITTPVDLTQVNNFRFGSTIKSITDKSLDSNGIAINLPGNTSGCLKDGAGGLGVFGSFGSYDGAQLQSGTQSVIMTCVPGLSTGEDAAAAAAKIKLIKSGAVNSKTDFEICFDSGRGKTALVTIGGNASQQLAVNLNMGIAC